MARMVNQHMTPGAPEKPRYLSEKAAKEWDRITGELADSNIQMSRAHRCLVEQAATISADIADARETVELEGAYIENNKTGAVQAHPAARRMDGLRRDYIKVLSLLGLRSAVQGESGGGSLNDALIG